MGQGPPDRFGCVAEPQSEQEDVVRKVLSAQLGSALMFAPDKWKGGGFEPCDVAWVCGDVAVLMWMKRADSGPYSDLDKHNRDQMSGGLRLWQLGYRLTGKNHNRTFDIGFCDVKHHVTISVVGGRHGNKGEWRKPQSDISNEKAKRYTRVAIDITIPDIVLLKMLGMSAGMHTLVDLARWMRDKRGPVSANALLGQLQFLHAHSVQRAEAVVGPGQSVAEARNYLRDLMTFDALETSTIEEAFRNADEANQDANWLPDVSGSASDPRDALVGLGGLIEMINDLRWTELLVLLSAITQTWDDWRKVMAKPVQPTPMRPFREATPISGARFLVYGFQDGYPDPSGMVGDRMVELTVNYRGNGAAILGFIMRKDKRPFPANYILPRTNRSSLSKRLDEIGSKRRAAPSS